MDEEKIKQVIDKIRPQLQADGGDIEFVEVTDDGVVKVRLLGHCAGCMHAQQTLTFGVERTLKQFIPEIKAVVNVPY
ncbi:MAG: NifU family protein [Candidatus Lokiarchaeota archaeon]|nr:NifU family protein [Candidatus Lokiarchaeota archaeon]